jgi:hypothetical protein
MPLDNAVVAFPSQPHEDNPFAKYDSPTSEIMFPIAERKVGWQMRDGAYMPTDSHKAIVRVDPRNIDRAYVISIVNVSYKTVHNRELLNIVQEAMLEHMPIQSLQGVEVIDRVSDYGRTCFREYRFPNIRCRIGGSAKSDIGFRCIAVNGYGGSAIKLYAGAIEFFCTNGMISGAHHAMYKRHTSDVKVFHVDRLIKGALATFTNNQHRWERWAKTPVQHYKALEFLKDIARSPSLLDKFVEHYLREREVRGETMWTLYSTLTYYSSHADGDFAPRRGNVEDGRIATTMHDRELWVAKTVDSARFEALAEA